MTDKTLEARPGSRSLWRNRDYLLLWCGQAISALGGSVSDLAFPLLILATTGSPALAGVGAALSTLGGAVIILIAGVLVDRWDRKRIMLYCDIGRFLSLVSIPVALAFGHLTLYQLYIAALIEGVLARFFDLAHAASVAQVVEETRLSTAIALDEVMEGTTALGGPALGGLLFSLGRALPFLTDAISYAISILTLLLIRVPFQGPREAAPPLSRRHVLAEVRVGLSWLWRQPFIKAMTVLMASGSFFISGSSLAIIVLAQQRGASPWMIGLIFALGGAGSIIGALLAPIWNRYLRVGQAVLLCRWCLTLLWPLYVLLPLAWMPGLVEFGVGFVDPIEDVAYFSYRLKLIPEELRGRVLSVCRLFPASARPLGLFCTGLSLQWLGPVYTLLLAWLGLLLCALVITFMRQIRQAGRAEPVLARS
ncbi:MAG TPA: MFS transporter [Ktedonobacteraceae bacterium]